jgi:hypothetical protein
LGFEGFCFVLGGGCETRAQRRRVRLSPPKRIELLGALKSVRLAVTNRRNKG